MKITIFQTGDVPKSLQAKYGEYPGMIEHMFERVDAPFTFETIRVNHNDPLPQPSTLEGVVVTGSSAGVYEDHTWLDPLRGFIRRAYDAGLPMFGICFGHQVIAQALGGDVRKFDAGWSLGRHEYRLFDRPALVADGPSQIAIGAAHQDQVIIPPAAARTFMASDFTAHAGLVYENGKVLTVQPHPEFAPAYTKAIALLRESGTTHELVAKAIKNASLPVDNDRVAGWAVGLFENAVRSR